MIHYLIQHNNVWTNQIKGEKKSFKRLPWRRLPAFDFEQPAVTQLMFYSAPARNQYTAIHMSLVLLRCCPPSRVRLRTEYGCGHNILILPRPWSIYQLSRVCALAIHSNDAMIYIGQRKTAKNSSSLFIFWKKKIKIFPSALCVLAGQKKKAKQHASWSD